MIYLYTLIGCPYCINAEKMLNKTGLKYKEIPVDSKDKEKYKKLHNMKTFPQIFINEPNTKDSIKIGGYNDLVDLLDVSLRICVQKTDPIAIKYCCDNIQFEMT